MREWPRIDFPMGHDENGFFGLRDWLVFLAERLIFFCFIDVLIAFGTLPANLFILLAGV